MISTYAERLLRLGRLQEGLEVAGTARTQARSSGNRLWLLFALRTMCTGYIELGRLPEAESTVQETASAVGNGPAMDARFLGLLDRLRGLLELQRGDAAAALQSARQIRRRGAVLRRLLVAAESVARGPDTSADVGEALLLLAKAEIAQGRAPEAQPLLERAARCLTNGLGADHAMTREALALAAHKRA